MKNTNINLLHNILSPLKLDLEKSSARRRILRHIKGFREDYDLEAEYLRKEYAEKNSDGGMKVVDKVIQFTKENRKLADAKFKELNDLDIKIDWTGEEVDKQIVVEILSKLAEDLKATSEFTDDSMEYLEKLQEINSELA